jgi:beta-lactamase class A
MTFNQQRRPVPTTYNYASAYQARRSPPAPPLKKSRHIVRKLVLLLVFCLVVGLGSFIAWQRHVSARALAIRRAEAVVAAARLQREEVAGEAITQIINANPTITFSVSVQDLGVAGSTIRHYGYSGDFDAASTGKLLTAADYLHHVEQGTASLNQNLDGETAGNWLQAMIVNSDDTAWQELNDYLTHADLSRYADAIGMSHYSPDDDLLNSNDITLLLQKLYDKQLLNNSDTTRLLQYMKQANYRTYIIPAVPAGDTVYHKVGLDDDDVHDVAVIGNGTQTVALAIFTDGNGTYDWQTRAQIIQQITRLVVAAYLS